MKQFKYIFSLFILLAITVACGDEYYDVNTPYGSADEEQLSMKDILAPAIYHTVQAQYSAENAIGYYTQNFTGQGGTTLGRNSASGIWSNVYLYSLPSLQTVIEKADEVNSNHYRGVAKLLMAVNMGLVTDSYGNAPYSEATSGTENTKPAFDTQEEIYNNIYMLIDEAIADLSNPDNSGFALGSEDLFYEGEMDKWLKAAYTLKARYIMHLSEVNGGSTIAQDVINALDNGFTSNDDDMQMFYDDRNINPWHSVEVLAANTGNFHHKVGDQLVSYMNGWSYPFTTIDYDPRLPEFADISDSSGEYKGYVSGGEGDSSNGEAANTDFADNGFYSSVDSPIRIITYAEANFLRAEAEFLKNGGTATSVGSTGAAYSAYMNGIQASMDKLGVDGSMYLAEPSIDVGASNLKLSDIMKEKYIDNFLNPETFVDLRRYDFSEDVFVDFELPIEPADYEFFGEWIVRLVYPTSEENRNSENVALNRESPIVPVWWDR